MIKMSTEIRDITVCTLPYGFSAEVYLDKRNNKTVFYMYNEDYCHKMHMFSIPELITSTEDIEDFVYNNSGPEMDAYIKMFGDEDNLKEYVESSHFDRKEKIVFKTYRKTVTICRLNNGYILEVEEKKVESEKYLTFHITHRDKPQKYSLDAVEYSGIIEMYGNEANYIEENITEWRKEFREFIEEIE